MKYSILLPYYDPEYEKTEKFSKLIRSIVRHASTDDYELVIVKDGNSYTESHNTALRNAHGDYFIIFNDDIEILDSEFIEKFTVDNAIGTWQGTAHAWSMSREVFNAIGEMDLIFKDGFNCEDTDYFHRATLLKYPIKDVGVNLKHNSNRLTYGDTELNKKLFIQKWGFNP